MTLTNQTIFHYAIMLHNEFNNTNIKLPVKINFFLQKNIQQLISAAQEIDKMRLQLGAQFGSINSTQNSYNIPPENIDEVNKELQDLFNLEQDIPLHIFKLSDFDGIELTYQQMAAIMFMVEED